MSTSIRTLGSDVLFYGVLDVLQRSIGFLLIPLYTRLLPQEQYGELDFLLTCAAGLAVLTDLQFIAAFTRLYHEHEQRGSAARLAGSCSACRWPGSRLPSFWPGERPLALGWMRGCWPPPPCRWC
jgi:O-antigen/teichoic acid export membrane protein